MDFRTKVTEGQSLLDLTVQGYSDVRALLYLATDNNLDPEADPDTGVEIVFRSILPGYVAPPVRQPIPVNRVASSTYRKPVEEGQDMLDMTLQEYGDISAIMLTVNDNNSEPENGLVAGVVLGFAIVPMVEVPGVQIRDYFRSKNQRINTHSRLNPSGFWITEDDKYWETEDGYYWQL